MREAIHAAVHAADAFAEDGTPSKALLDCLPFLRFVLDSLEQLPAAMRLAAGTMVHSAVDTAMDTPQEGTCLVWSSEELLGRTVAEQPQEKTVYDITVAHAYGVGKLLARNGKDQSVALPPLATFKVTGPGMPDGSIERLICLEQQPWEPLNAAAGQVETQDLIPNAQEFVSEYLAIEEVAVQQVDEAALALWEGLQRSSGKWAGKATPMIKKLIDKSIVELENLSEDRLLRQEVRPEGRRA